MKKILALLLALVMMLSVLTACGQTPEETQAPEQTNSPEQTQPQETEVPDWKVEHPTWLCEEKQTLTVLTYDGVSSSATPPSNDLEYWKWLEEYTNVHIEWEIVPYAGYEEVIQARLAAGTDLPDIINVYTTANAINAGSNGLLLDLAPYWDTHFTQTKAYFAEEGTDYKNLITDGNGCIYALHGTTEPVEGHVTLCYNTLWMEALGAEIPRTIEEFTALLQQMKAAGDLNGNGIDDEICFTSADMQKLYSAIGTAFDLETYLSMEPYAVREDGVVYDEYTAENQKYYLEYLHSLYEEGLLDPEITSMSASALSEKCASDRVGVFAYYTGFAPSYGAMTSAGQNDKNGEYFTLGYPLTSEYNDTAYFTRREVVSNSLATAVTTECENPDLAMRWLDVMFGCKEVVTVRTCGFEGVHYKLNAEGEMELIMPEDGSNWGGVEGGNQITLAFIQTKEQLLNTKQSYPWYLEQYAYLREELTWKSPSIVHAIGYTPEEQEIVDFYNTDVKTYYAEMRDKFVKGEADLDTEWETYISTMEQLGVNEMTAAWQSVYDRTK